VGRAIHAADFDAVAVLLCCWALGAASGQEIVQEIVPPEPILDLADCKLAALQAGNWKRDGWDARTQTGEHLVACMQAKGYRHRTIGHSEAYNPVDEERPNEESP
jgi:hypothetical protein